MTFFRKLALLSILILSACQSKTPESKQVLHLNISQDAASLDPRIVRQIKDLTIVRQLFEGLMRVDSKHVPQLALADGYTISENGLVYTFHLRDHQWTNGERITADDFVYSWKKTLDPNFATEYAHMLFPIKNAEKARTKRCSLDEVGVVALDSRTLQVHLEQPTPYFLELVAFPTFYPVNQNVDQNFPLWMNPPGKHFVSCGPFSLEKWIPDEEIILKKNEGYWDVSNVFLDKIAFSMISDSNTESLLFMRGKLDWLGQPLSNTIAPELLSQLKEKKALDSYPVAGTFWFKCNVAVAPFNNDKIRKAFALSLSRQEIIDHILLGNQSVATSPIPPTLALNQAPLFSDGNAEEALRLFEEGMCDMGWTRENFPEVTLKYYNTDRSSKIVQFVQQQWQQAFNVPIHLAGLEYQVYRQDSRTRNFQIATGEWMADYHDPLAFLEIFLPTCAINETGWHDDQFNTLVQSSILESDPQKRFELMREAEKILADAMPVIPLYHYSFDYVKKKGVEGVVLSPLGGSDLKSVRIR